VPHIFFAIAFYISEHIYNVVAQYRMEERLEPVRFRGGEAVIGSVLYLPLFRWREKVPAHVWWSHSERVRSAVEDLSCVEVSGK